MRMRILDFVARTAYTSCIGLARLTSASSAIAASLPMPTGKQLTATVAKLDDNLFAAYNDCDLTSFAHYIAPDIHFYHDKSGFGRSGARSWSRPLE